MDALYKLFSTLGLNDIAAIVLLLGIFIDISPKIKWNPIKSIFGYLGRSFNMAIQKEIMDFKNEVNDKFEELKQEQTAQRITLDKLVTDQENKEISRLRWEIIDFENSLNNGLRHSREQYRHILDNAAKFERLIDPTDETDDNVLKIREATERIKRHYDEGRLNQTALFF